MRAAGSRSFAKSWVASFIAVASVKVGVANSSVCPSGAALVTDETAILPPPPGRGSTTTGCPQASCRCSATMRANTSGLGPTMILTGRLGKFCSCAKLGDIHHRTALIAITAAVRPRRSSLLSMRHLPLVEPGAIYTNSEPGRKAMPAGIKPIRRVVTGNDAQGRSRVLFDSAAPNVNPGAISRGTCMTDVWVYESSPAVITGERDDGNLPFRFEPP